MATTNAINKITKMLSLAFKNNNKEEATSAFRTAFTYMKRESVTYEELFNVSIYEGVDPQANSSNREKELVAKYNTLLQRAKDLKDELDRAKANNNSDYLVKNLESRLEDANDMISNQASEILRLRGELKTNKYTFKDMGVCFVVSAIIGCIAAGMMIDKQIKYIDRPVPIVSANSAPVTPYKAPVESGDDVINNAASKAPVDAPRAVKTYSLAYGASESNGSYAALIFTVYSDGSVKDNLGKEYNKPGKDDFIIKSDYSFNVGGRDYIVDSAPLSVVNKYLPKEVRSDLTKAANNGCNVYFTTYAKKLVNVVSCKNKLFYTDINGYGEVKVYTYDSTLDTGDMKYTKEGSNKYILVNGVDFNSVNKANNNTLYTFRGNEVVSFNQ